MDPQRRGRRECPDIPEHFCCEASSTSSIRYQFKCSENYLKYMTFRCQGNKKSIWKVLWTFSVGRGLWAADKCPTISLVNCIYNKYSKYFMITGCLSIKITLTNTDLETLLIVERTLWLVDLRGFLLYLHEQLQINCQNCAIQTGKLCTSLTHL